MSLSGKHILLGITGGIAAYKCPDLIRHLIKAGADVRVVMTKSAQHFVSPMTLQVVSMNSVSTDLFDPAAELSMGHIELAKWADLVLIAPATANIIAKIAHGIADDLLSTLCLATEAKIAIAPAMNQQMYQAVATQANLANLASRGVCIWGPDSGFQACGDIGPGRMLEPIELVKQIQNDFSAKNVLTGLLVTVTAGPTIEELDPVRYISNYSSGKMGFSIAASAAELGADVILISGPVQLETPKGVRRIDVKSALEMHEKAISYSTQSAIFISCAAVADFRAEQICTQKIKKQEDCHELQIKLVKNPDIVESVAALKKNRPFVVGFAAETDHVEQNALKKLVKKQLDMICANDVSDKKIGFNADKNQLTLYWKDGKQILPVNSKKALAKQLMHAILARYQANQIK